MDRFNIALGKSPESEPTKTGLGIQALITSRAFLPGTTEFQVIVEKFNITSSNVDFVFLIAGTAVVSPTFRLFRVGDSFFCNMKSTLNYEALLIYEIFVMDINIEAPRDALLYYRIIGSGGLIHHEQI